MSPEKGTPLTVGMLNLTVQQLRRIRTLAEETYPHECCGVLVGTDGGDVRTVERVVPAENRRTDSPANRYLISPEMLRSLETDLRGTGRSVLGFFHSHPDVAARPSEYDREHAWPWYSYLIVSVRDGKAEEIRSWRLKEDRAGFDSEEWSVREGSDRLRPGP